MTKKDLAKELAEIMHNVTPSVNVEKMSKRLYNNMTEREIERAISYMKLTHTL